MTKDGIVVVYHDENLLRCTDVKTRLPDRNNYNLADFNLTELASLDAGSWFAAQLELPAGARQSYLQSLSDREIKDYISLSDKELFASGAVKIPTLDEALKLANDLGLMVNVELKSPVADVNRFIKTVINSIAAAEIGDRVLISSFDHGMLTIVRKYSKTVATAALTDDPLKAPISTLRKLKAQAYNINCFKGLREFGYDSSPGKRYLTHLSRIRNAGFNVNVWTCNDTGEMLGLLPTGVSGIISDYPNRVRTALELFLTRLPSKGLHRFNK
jgi:glycerophosphoryl diester phosphodiesterase